MLLPRKLRAPMDARDNRKDVLEYSAFIIDSASATIVPLPTELRIRVLVLDVAAEVRPVWTTLPRSYPMPRR